MNIIYWVYYYHVWTFAFIQKSDFQHYAFQGHPLRTKGDKDVLGIVQEFLLPSSNPQELHKQDFGTESLPGILEKGKGALHIFSVHLFFFFF